MPVPVPAPDMERRAFLRRASRGVGLAGLAGLAGCFTGGGNGTTPSRTYAHRTFTPSPTPAGIVNTELTTATPSPTEFVVTYGVRNNSEDRQTAVVRVTVAFERSGTPDAVTREREETVTLGGTETTELQFSFERPEGAMMTDLESSIEPAE